MMIIPHLDSTTLSAPVEITTCTRVEMVGEADLHQELQERDMIIDVPI